MPATATLATFCVFSIKAIALIHANVLRHWNDILNKTVIVIIANEGK